MNEIEEVDRGYQSAWRSVLTVLETQWTYAISIPSFATQSGSFIGKRGRNIRHSLNPPKQYGRMGGARQYPPIAICEW
jgi:hypothetical protein